MRALGLPDRALPIGKDIRTNKPVSIGLKRLSEHVDVMGPTGVGKTQGVLLPLFQELARMRDVSVIAVTCKGGFASMCADFAIGHGLTDRLVVFNPGQTLLGFNPLRKNGWPAERHAKMARTAVLAARGEHSLDQMPQLSRLLFLSLAVAFEQNLDLVKAARLLRPGKSVLRNDMIRVVQSEFLRESLEWFNSLKDVRQEEIGASTAGRLENLVSDPLIRTILTEQTFCLDVADIIRNHKKLCIDVGFYNPLVPDDAKTMLRLLINNILAHKFAIPKAEQTPTILLLDEVQEYATEDLATALTLGRELKLFVVMAHQFPSQLKLSADDSHLFEAVQECCRTKIVFGGLHVSELEGVVKELVIDQFNPYFIKDERKTLELEPIETTRETATRGFTIGGSLGMNRGTSSATALGKSRGVSKMKGTSENSSNTVSSAHVSGASSMASTGETILPNGEIITVAHAGAGSSQSDMNSQAFTDAYGLFESHGTQETTSKTETAGRQTGFSVGLNGSWNQSRTRTPFYEYIKRWVVSSRTFQTLEEFLTLALQTIKAQPRGHFVLKVPDHKAVFVRAHFVREPWISNALRTRALERIYRSLAPPEPPEKHIEPAAPYQVPAVEVKSREAPPPPPKQYPLDWGS